MGTFKGLGLPFFGCIILMIASVFQILVFASPYWISEGGLTWGLWRKRICLEGIFRDCYQFNWVEINVPGWLMAVRGMQSVAIIFMVIPLVVLPVYMYVASGLYYKRTMAAASGSCLLSVLNGETFWRFVGFPSVAERLLHRMEQVKIWFAIFIFIGIIVIGSNSAAMGWSVDWSFFLCILGGALTTFSFIVFLLASLKGRPKSEDFYASTQYIADDPMHNTVR